MRIYFLMLASNLVTLLWQSIPIPVIHNLQKATMLKKLFWQQNIDAVHGDYLEFGVAHGNSMKSALLASQKSGSKMLGIVKIERNFHGFDTFEEFNSSFEMDQHETWTGDRFSLEIHKVSRRFKKYDNVFLHKLDVQNIGELELKTLLGSDGKVAIALFDMDLYGPTITALDWIEPRIQKGTYLVFDEFFAFRGDSKLGESRALEEFLARYRHIHLRPVMQYGAGGQVFVVSDC